jgi:hypothetical protein
MQTLIPCFSCRGLVPSDHDACPNCGAKKRSWVRRNGLLLAVAAGAAAVTLMACYGMPPCDYEGGQGQNPYGCWDPDAGTDAGQ